MESRLIVLKNPDGKNRPLFWCCQGDREFDQLAHYLGEVQPVYGFRSGPLIRECNRNNIEGLAAYYVDEMLKLDYQGPYAIGGNCQGAVLAFEIAQKLTSRGQHISLLLLLEWTLKHFHYQGKIAFFYGRQNDHANADDRFKEPEKGWNKYYNDYSIDFIPCGHRQFWDEPNIQVFIEKMVRRLAEANAVAPKTPSTQVYHADLEIMNKLAPMFAGEKRLIPVNVTNRSPITWPAAGVGNLRLGNRWLDEQKEIIEYLDGRAPLFGKELKPDQSIEVFLPITAPMKPGAYQMALDMCEAGSARFSNSDSESTYYSVEVYPDEKEDDQGFKFPYPDLAESGPVLVGGTGGSGTRVIAAILRSAGVYMGEKFNASNDSMEMVPVVLECNSWIMFGDYSPRFEHKISSVLHDNLSKYLKKLSENSEYGKPWGWKLPPTIFALPLLHRFLPTLKCIHMIRDGRDMAFSSNQNQPLYFGPVLLDETDQLRRLPERAIIIWQKLNETAADYGVKHLPGQYLQIRYEDLCSDTRQTLEIIFHFLGLEADVEEFISYVRPSDGIGRWRRQEADQILRIEKLAESALLRFGYKKT